MFISVLLLNVYAYLYNLENEKNYEKKNWEGDNKLNPFFRQMLIQYSEKYCYEYLGQIAGQYFSYMF